MPALVRIARWSQNLRRVAKSSRGKETSRLLAVENTMHTEYVQNHAKKGAVVHDFCGPTTRGVAFAATVRAVSDAPSVSQSLAGGAKNVN